jgi:hypothetical protein
MSDTDTGAAATGTTAATTATGTTATTPWYEGKLDADTIGHVQHKGWDKDLITAAIEASKAHRLAEKALGGPSEQLIRLPKDAKDEVGWNSVWNRLGKPADPKGYDFSVVKLADGTAIDASFADAIRKTAFENHIPKDAATAFARAVIKHAEATDATEALDAKTKWDAGVARIKENWGPNFNANTLQAMEGARKLGISQELYDTMAKAAGVDVVAELFRKIGSGISEHKFVEGNQGGLPVTVESARAERAALMTDKEWMTRYRKGGTAEKIHMHNLNQIISGVTDTAA